MPTIWFAAAGLYASVRIGGYEDPWLGLAAIAVNLTLIVTFMIVAMRLSMAGVRAFAKRSSGPHGSTTLLHNVIKLVLLILGSALVSGLAVALALQDTLGNLFAGMQIIVSRQIRPGDYVALASGEEGTVTD